VHCEGCEWCKGKPKAIPYASDFLIVEQDGKFAIEFYDPKGEVIQTVVLKSVDEAQKLLDQLQASLAANDN
jgi:hypothetical protein